MRTVQAGDLRQINGYCLRVIAWLRYAQDMLLSYLDSPHCPFNLARGAARCYGETTDRHPAGPRVASAPRASTSSANRKVCNET